MNLKAITELSVRIRNLKEILDLTIRYGESDLGREVRETIRKKERELDILKKGFKA